MRSVHSHGQLILFPDGEERAQRAAAAAGTPARRFPPRLGRNARMAERLDRIADAAERDAVASRRAGDVIAARAARDRAADARRAAALLRAGPAGVGKVLAS
ncbi:MAG: hypothetical protein QOD86_2580 [Miltoncostaeaceae bacterium]|jgi:hypothetical protein|nr:hypothetical protein [Miltoncostaeaceae bacterium]